MMNRDYERRLEDRKQLRKIRDSENKARRSASNADALDREIDARKRAAQADALGDEMLDLRKRTLHEIENCTSIFKDQWYQRLDRLDLTSGEAGAELKSLLGSVELAILIGGVNLSGIPGQVGLLGKSPSSESKPAGKKRRSRAPNIFEMEREQKEREREQAEKERERIKSLNESSLQLLKSSLGLLIALRARYESLSGQG